MRIAEIDDRPIELFEDLKLLDTGQIGEIVVRGPSVTTSYFRREEANRAAKVRDRDSTWHRMGDVGYLDSTGRLWFCGRKNHRVETEHETLFSVPCEAIFNQHPDVRRSALVGLGDRPRQQPLIIIECQPDSRPGDRLVEELKHLAEHNPLTDSIQLVLFHDGFPVDIRHNVKINREELARWAAAEVADGTGLSAETTR